MIEQIPFINGILRFTRYEDPGLLVSSVIITQGPLLCLSIDIKCKYSLNTIKK